MPSDKLVRFAAGVNAGKSARAAALEAGYSPSTADKATSDLVERARAAGLLLSPQVIRDAVQVLEDALPGIADTLVRVASGERPKHREQLAAIRELWDRARGKPPVHIHGYKGEGDRVKQDVLDALAAKNLTPEEAVKREPALAAFFARVGVPVVGTGGNDGQRRS